MRKIAVISGKGGVGKTTVTSNVGTALALNNVNCVVIDANIGVPNLGVHLNMLRVPFGIRDVLMGKAQANDAIIVDQYGLKLLLADAQIKNRHRGVSLANLPLVFDSLTEEVALVDSPPGVNEESDQVLAACDEILIVTTPDLPSLTACLELIDQARTMEKKITGVIVNRVKNKPHELSATEIGKLTNVNVLAMIPEDPLVPESISARVPLEKYSPDSPAAVAIEDLAFVLVGRQAKKRQLNPMAKIMAFFEKLFG